MAGEDRDKKELNSANKYAKILCVCLLFVLVYGRMIYSTFSESSGFNRKNSVLITNTTITG